MRALATAAGLCLVVTAAACGLPCNTTADCFEGWTCGADSRCHLPGDNGSSGSGGGSSSSGGPGCPMPNLYALVQSVDGSQQNAGQVLRWSLPPDGNPVSCSALNLRGALPSRMGAVGWIGDGRIAVGNEGQVLALNVEGDTVAWTYTEPRATSGYPLALFPSQTLAGRRVVAVLAQSAGDSDIAYVDLLDPAMDGALTHHFKTTDSNSPLPLTSLAMMGAPNPRAPGHLLYMELYAVAARDVVLPVDGGVVSPTTYIRAMPMGSFPKHITSTYGPGDLGRVAFTAPSGSGADNLWLANDNGSTHPVRGPFTCDACPAPLKLVHAVPDPTHADRVFAICVAEGSQRNHVVRADINGPCDLILNGTSLLPLSYPHRLAVGVP